MADATTASEADGERDAYQVLIGGEWTDAASGATDAVVNPATGAAFAEVPRCDAEDTKAAIDAARDAFDRGEWSGRTPGERARVLLKLADLLEDHAEALGRLETRDQGKTIKQSRDADIPFSADNLRFFAGAARTLEDTTGGAYVGGIESHLRREPVGVVGSIVPWNYPLMIAVWKAAPALAAGNSVVVKPASRTPLSALELGRLAQEAGIPDGVLNVVTGPGGEVGQALAESPDVDLVSLTGGTETGGALMAAASKTVKRLHLELGGKAPFVVLDDADLDAATTGAVVGAWWNGGQDCTQACRFLVHESVHDRFVGALVEKTGRVRMGDPLDEATDLGPLVSDAHRDSVQADLRAAVDQGAKPALEGGPVEEAPFEEGTYFAPAVLTNVTQEMDIARDEVFGPVVTVQSFATDDEALEMANAVPQGLYSSVWTEDVRRAHRLANGLDFGAVCVNDHLPLASEMPHGGFKQSGFGKDLSVECLREYTRLKHVLIEMTGAVDKPWHGVVYPGGD